MHTATGPDLHRHRVGLCRHESQDPYLSRRSRAGLSITTSTTSTSAGVAVIAIVTAQDAYDNTVPTFTGTIHFVSNDPQAVLPADYNFALSAKGVHGFPVILKTAGTETITVTDAANAGLTATASVSVTPGKAAKLMVAGPSSATSGRRLPLPSPLSMLTAISTSATSVL